jgi:hypothetical protein
MGSTKGRARGQSTSISGGGDDVLTESPRSRSQNRTCPGHLRRGSDCLVSLGRFPRNPARGFHIDPYLSDSRAGPLIPEPRTGSPPTTRRKPDLGRPAGSREQAPTLPMHQGGERPEGGRDHRRLSAQTAMNCRPPNYRRGAVSCPIRSWCGRPVTTARRVCHRIGVPYGIAALTD